jgi:hypothetical protein
LFVVNASMTLVTFQIKSPWSCCLFHSFCHIKSLFSINCSTSRSITLNIGDIQNSTVGRLTLCTSSDPYSIELRCWLSFTLSVHLYIIVAINGISCWSNLSTNWLSAFSVNTLNLIQEFFILRITTWKMMLVVTTIRGFRGTLWPCSIKESTAD